MKLKKYIPLILVCLIAFFAFDLSSSNKVNADQLTKGTPKTLRGKTWVIHSKSDGEMMKTSTKISFHFYRTSVKVKVYNHERDYDNGKLTHKHTDKTIALIKHVKYEKISKNEYMISNGKTKLIHPKNKENASQLVFDFNLSFRKDSSKKITVFMPASKPLPAYAK